MDIISWTKTYDTVTSFHVFSNSLFILCVLDSVTVIALLKGWYLNKKITQGLMYKQIDQLTLKPPLAI